MKKPDRGVEVSPEDRPKILRRTPPPPAAAVTPAAVPARMINEVLYCERLMYLEWAQGEFQDNFFTVDGRSVHRRADEPGKPLPEPEDGTPMQARSVWLTSEQLGITAKIDVVEVSDDGTVAPIEYKRGNRPDVAEGAWLPERAQLCAHVLLLRDHGYRCDRAYVYYAGDRRRVEIEVGDELIGTTLFAARRAREVAGEGRIPPPLDDSPKCNGCSLVGICLPDEVQLLRRLAGEPEVAEPEEDLLATDLEGPMEADPWGLAGTQADPDTELRRLHPARDDRLPVYVQEQGARISLAGERLIIRGRTIKMDARLPNTSQVALFGNVQITTQAVATLLRRGIPVSFFSSGGWFLGRAAGTDSKNVELRRAQYRAADDVRFRTRFARRLVASKILNSRTLLRRNVPKADPTVLFELKQLARKALEAPGNESLLGIEGTAARTYFSSFTGMLKGPGETIATFDLDGRNRRPPKDPVNALLSFCYALLSKELVVVLAAVGLDPLLGFYHQPRFGRPALALDLMEEFRPLIADSVVVTAINNGVVTGADFVRSPAGVALTADGRKKLIHAFERRMDQLVTHPVFGYRISYRRVLEVQCRLLSRVLLGELAEYPEFRTR